MSTEDINVQVSSSIDGYPGFIEHYLNIPSSADRFEETGYSLPGQAAEVSSQSAQQCIDPKLLTWNGWPEEYNKEDESHVGGSGAQVERNDKAKGRATDLGAENVTVSGDSRDSVNAEVWESLTVPLLERYANEQTTTPTPETIEFELGRNVLSELIKGLPTAKRPSDPQWAEQKTLAEKYLRTRFKLRNMDVGVPKLLATMSDIFCKVHASFMERCCEEAVRRQKAGGSSSLTVADFAFEIKMKFDYILPFQTSVMTNIGVSNVGLPAPESVDTTANQTTLNAGAEKTNQKKATRGKKVAARPRARKSTRHNKPIPEATDGIAQGGDALPSDPGNAQGTPTLASAHLPTAAVHESRGPDAPGGRKSTKAKKKTRSGKRASSDGPRPKALQPLRDGVPAPQGVSNTIPGPSASPTAAGLAGSVSGPEIGSVAATFTRHGARAGGVNRASGMQLRSGKQIVK